MGQVEYSKEKLEDREPVNSHRYGAKCLNARTCTRVNHVNIDHTHACAGTAYHRTVENHTAPHKAHHGGEPLANL